MPLDASKVISIIGVKSKNIDDRGIRDLLDFEQTNSTKQCGKFVTWQQGCYHHLQEIKNTLQR